MRHIASGIALMGTLMAASITGLAHAQDVWVQLSGAQIDAALHGRKLVYARAWQEFRPSGRTLYNAGQDSWGYWAVRGDQYCSQWPPSDVWACYDMTQNGDRLRFVGPGGDISEGVYAD